MKKSLIVALATFSTVLFGITISAYADDHLATAVDAGGLDPATSHVFTVEKAVEAPGQGSPLSGEDHTTPASATIEHKVDGGFFDHAFKDNPAAASGKTAPSANSNH